MVPQLFSDKIKTLILQYKIFLEEEVYPVELHIITHPFKQSLPLLNRLRTKAKESCGRLIWQNMTVV
jgi:hypothetical protein